MPVAPPDSAASVSPILLRWVDALIPASVHAMGPALVRRARTVLCLAYPMVILSIPGLIELIMRGAYPLLAVVMVGDIIALTSPLLLRWRHDVRVVASLLFTNLFGMVSAAAWLAGGFGAPALYVLLITPVFGTLAGGRRFGRTWGLLALVLVGAFAALTYLDLIPPTELTTTTLRRSHGLAVMCLLVALTVAVGVYERLRTQALAELEAAKQQAQQAQQQAEKALQRAEAANRAKGDFLANISHELRTPMTGVMTASAILADMSLEEEAHDLAKIVHTSSDALLAVIDDILDFARLEEGQIRLRDAPFDVIAVTREVVGLLLPKANARSLKLAMEFEVQELVVVGDKARLRQILVNLLGNAVKFTDEGSVTVQLTSTSESDGEHIALDVIDTGVGLTEAQQARVFERFERVEDGDQPQRAGAGLGLSISRHLAQLMGGTLTVSSVRGEGSRFMLRVTLPQSDAPLPGRTSLSELRGEAVEILLAEDNLVNRRVCSALLEHLGCRVDMAHDGAEAVEMVQAKSYGLVLMDCRMPKLDGFEATRRIRAQGGALATLPIIAFTASGSEDDRASCLRAGMNDIITKPVRAPQLAKLLRRWVSQDAQSQDAQSQDAQSQDAQSQDAQSQGAQPAASASPEPATPPGGRPRREEASR